MGFDVLPFRARSAVADGGKDRDAGGMWWYDEPHHEQSPATAEPKRPINLCARFSGRELAVLSPLFASYFKFYTLSLIYLILGKPCFFACQIRLLQT